MIRQVIGKVLLPVREEVDYDCDVPCAKALGQIFRIQQEKKASVADFLRARLAESRDVCGPCENAANPRSLFVPSQTSRLGLTETLLFCAWINSLSAL